MSMASTLYENPLLDWVGYEALIAFIRKNGIHHLKGDFVEIGALFGGGSRKLSKFLDTHAPKKKLYVIDIFNLLTDTTMNTKGDRMAKIYTNALSSLGYNSQLEIFQKVTEGCKNIQVLKGDSKMIEIPTKQIAFAIIDGNHDPEYVLNDFYLVWDKLVIGGCVAFDDYGDDLPQVTATIDQIVRKHNKQLNTTLLPQSRVMYLTKVKTNMQEY